MFFFMTFAARSGAVCTIIETYEFLCFYWHDKGIMINGISKNSFLVYKIVGVKYILRPTHFIERWITVLVFLLSISISIIYIPYLNRKVIIINQKFDWVLWIWLYTYLSLVSMSSVDCQMFWIREKIEENVKIWTK